MNGSITKRTVDAARPAERDWFIWDTELPGFGLKITPTGRKTFVYQYRTGGRGTTAKRYTIGPHGPLTPEMARRKARSLAGAVADGNDPERAKQDARKAETFGELCNEYLTRHAEKEKAERSRKEDERIIGRELKPAWGTWKAGEIRRRDVVKLLDAIADRGAPVMANRTLALARKIFNFGIMREIVEANPCSGLRPSSEKPRERVLSPHEIKTFWTALDTAKADWQTRAALRLILATAQRPGEVAGMRRAELNLGEGWWEIPAERTKTGRAHRVPLSVIALEIINGLPETGFEQVFPTIEKDGVQHCISVQALSRAVRRNANKWKVEGAEETMEPFTPHRLRATAATRMGELGTEPWIVDAIQNHALGKIARTYNKSDYFTEKRRALERWGRELQRIIEDKEETKVVQLPARG